MAENIVHVFLDTGAFSLSASILRKTVLIDKPVAVDTFQSPRKHSRIGLVDKYGLTPRRMASVVKFTERIATGETAHEETARDIKIALKKQRKPRTQVLKVS